MGKSRADVTTSVYANVPCHWKISAKFEPRHGWVRVIGICVRANEEKASDVYVWDSNPGPGYQRSVLGTQARGR